MLWRKKIRTGIGKYHRKFIDPWFIFIQPQHKTCSDNSLCYILIKLGFQTGMYYLFITLSPTFHLWQRLLNSSVEPAMEQSELISISISKPRNRSEIALVTMVDLYWDLDWGSAPVLVFLDLLATFNAVKYGILELWEFKTGGTVLQWFYSSSVVRSNHW